MSIHWSTILLRAYKRTRVSRYKINYVLSATYGVWLFSNLQQLDGNPRVKQKKKKEFRKLATRNSRAMLSRFKRFCKLIFRLFVESDRSFCRAVNRKQRATKQKKVVARVLRYCAVTWNILIAVTPNESYASILPQRGAEHCTLQWTIFTYSND